MKFNELVFKQLSADRSELVVDSLHAYARIAQRLRSLWDGLCLLGEDKMQGTDILACLFCIGSMTQHCAESLGLVETQGNAEAEAKLKDEEIRQLKATIKELLTEIGRSARLTSPVQLGKKRYIYEFDEDTFHRFMNKAIE